MDEDRVADLEQDPFSNLRPDVPARGNEGKFLQTFPILSIPLEIFLLFLCADN